MASSLENLTGPGKPLRIEAPDAKEFSGLKLYLPWLGCQIQPIRRTPWKAGSTLPTTPPMRFVWPRCAGMDSGRQTVTSCFKSCRTHSG